MTELIKKFRNRQLTVTEEDIMLYYQSHLKHKELSEIVKQQVGHDETTIDASSVTPTKTQQRMLPKFIQSA